MKRNPCRGWANGDPVSYVDSRDNVIATGEVVVRKSNKGTWYLKIALKTPGTGLGRFGEWVWPEGWVIGQGPFRSKCLECGQAFRTDDKTKADVEFCLACDRRMEAAHAAASGIRSPLRYMRGAVTPMPQATHHTAQDLAAIAAQKADDDANSPY